MQLPTKKELDAIDMTDLVKLFKPCPETRFLLLPAGQEHYRLLRWLSNSSDGLKIAELGTYYGLSAVAFASNPKSQVICYDVDFRPLMWVKKPDNAYCLQILDSESFPPTISDADIIFVDTNHFGNMEAAVYKHLHDIHWHGLLIYDDIYLNPAMKTMWDNIDHPGKADLTELGHTFGTGIIAM